VAASEFAPGKEPPSRRWSISQPAEPPHDRPVALCARKPLACERSRICSDISR